MILSEVKLYDLMSGEYVKNDQYKVILDSPKHDQNVSPFLMRSICLYLEDFLCNYDHHNGLYNNRYFIEI